MPKANQCKCELETFLLGEFDDLRFADWDTKEICGFAILGLIITYLRICDLRTGTPRKFADLPLRISDWLTKKKICLPTLTFFSGTLHRNKHPICICLGWLYASVKGTVSRDGYFLKVLSVKALMVFNVFQCFFTTFFTYFFLNYLLWKGLLKPSHNSILSY